MTSLHAAPLPDAAARKATTEMAMSFVTSELEKQVYGEQLVPNWRKNGSQFWFAADRAGGVEYLRVDPDARSAVPLFSRARLEAALRNAKTSPLPEELKKLSYDFDEDEISFEHDGQRWIWSSGSDRLMPAGKEEGGLSPDKRWQARVRDHNLYIENKRSGEIRQLTTDGSASRPYARPTVTLTELVAQGTTAPKLPADVVWSPDSSRFVTYRANLEGARRLSTVQSTPPDWGAPRVFDYVYVLAGDENIPTAQTLIVNVESGEITYPELPRHEMLWAGGPRFAWTRDSDAVLQNLTARGYGSMRLYSIDASTGKASVLTTDESDRFVNSFTHRWRYVESANAVAWLSDVDGWNQVSLVERNGTRRLLTKGEWTVTDLAGSDSSGQRLFVIGQGRDSGRDPYLKSLYSLDLTSGRTTSLTPEPVDHDVYVSPDGRFFVDNQSLVDRPTKTFLRSARDGAVLMKLQEADISEFERRDLILPERFTVTAADGKTPLYGVIYKPSTFSSEKRYPIVEYMYTGPHHVAAPTSFVGALRTDAAFAVAELGYIVVVVDGRGTAGRGRAFLDPAYKNLHAVGLDDHVAAIRTLASDRPYMNVEAVGVYGFSAGGYDVVRAMTRRPDFYKVGIAACGNHDHRLDKANWNEQWMGFPLGEQYEANSNITWANKLEGRLFLAHGELDENVPLAATLRLVDALIKAEKSFEFLVVPNADHLLGRVASYNRYRFDFLLRSLAPTVP